MIFNVNIKSKYVWPRFKFYEKVKPYLKLGQRLPKYHIVRIKLRNKNQYSKEVIVCIMVGPKVFLYSIGQVKLTTLHVKISKTIIIYIVYLNLGTNIGPQISPYIIHNIDTPTKFRNCKDIFVLKRDSFV